MAKVKALRDNIEHGVVVDGKNQVSVFNRGDVFEVTDEQALQLAEEGIVQLPKGFKLPEGDEVVEPQETPDEESTEQPSEDAPANEG